MKRVFSCVGIVSSLLTFLFIFLFEQNNGMKFLKIGESGLSFIGTILIFLSVFTFAFSLYYLFHQEKSTYLKNTLFGCLLLSLIISLGFYLVKVDFQKEETPKEDTVEEVEITTYEVSLEDYETDLVFKNSGTYLLSGTLKHTIKIDTEDSVTFLLNNVTIHSSLAFQVLNGELTIENMENSSNEISSLEGIVSNGDVLIRGSGTLTMNVSSFGISSNHVTIENTNFILSSKKDGILSSTTLTNSNFYLEAKETGVSGIADITDGITFISAKKGFNETYTKQNGTLLLLEDELSSKEDVLTFTLDVELDDDVFSVEKEDREIISFKSPSPFRYLSISLENLDDGTYYLLAGGNHEGDIFYGIYEKGLLIGSTKVSESTLESNIIEE